jgi:hypothetical protein
MTNRRRHQRHRRAATLTVLGGFALVPAAATQAKVAFDFDYSLDVNSFFTPAARTALEQAATVFSDRFLDKLPAIVPGNGESWETRFANPGTGAEHAPDIANLTIPADTLKIYVGGRALGGALGLGGPGGFSATPTIFQTLLTRGQPGVNATPPTDFGGRWGGAISFDNSAAWSFDLAAPQSGANDFLSVATHELAHALGIGTAESWKLNFATASGFKGPKTQALYGGLVPLNPTGDHFNFGTMSTVGAIGGPPGVAQEMLMDPDIITGTRKYMTLLDWAALDDLGWDLARPGDANADGLVNFDDLLVLAKNYNKLTRRWAEADFSADGLVNFDDLLLLAKNYNATTPQASAVAAATSPDFAADWSAAQALAAVPEPTSIATLVFATIPALGMRRRRA